MRTTKVSTFLIITFACSVFSGSSAFSLEKTNAASPAGQTSGIVLSVESKLDAILQQARAASQMVKQIEVERNNANPKSDLQRLKQDEASLSPVQRILEAASAGKLVPPVPYQMPEGVFTYDLP